MIEYDDTIGQEVIVVEPVEISMATINETADRIISISNNISSSITTWKEMDMQMHQMDLQFNAFMAGLNTDLEKYKARLPIVEKALDDISRKMDKFVDKIISMEAETDREFEMKMKMMEHVEKYTDKISECVMKLL